ncbi:MAG: YpmA family protein [Peptococcaceae bacterium]|nr:YpmA family protein [Candidatus Syntrophopropionicum ammoniitolerans]
MKEIKYSGGARLDLIAIKSFKTYDDMYKVVDFLNKTLKDKGVIFGLTKNKLNETMSISIYEI